ncbi:MAG: glutamate--tRNA ligase, partial [Deltaproteobacteria bacterium]
ESVVNTLKERSKTVLEMADFAEFYYREEIVYDEKASEKFLKPDMVVVFESLINRFKTIDDNEFKHDGIEKAFGDLTTEKGLKLKDVAQPVRVALTGGTISPGIFEIIEVLGKETAIKRLQKGMDFTKRY